MSIERLLSTSLLGLAAAGGALDGRLVGGTTLATAFAHLVEFLAGADAVERENRRRASGCLCLSSQRARAEPRMDRVAQTVEAR